MHPGDDNPTRKKNRTGSVLTASERSLGKNTYFCNTLPGCRQAMLNKEGGFSIAQCSGCVALC